MCLTGLPHHDLRREHKLQTVSDLEIALGCPGIVSSTLPYTFRRVPTPTYSPKPLERPAQLGHRSARVRGQPLMKWKTQSE
jgi:hypothetical protein